MSLGGGGEQTSTTTNKVKIPGFAKPLARQAVGAQAGALGELESLLGPGASLVAPFNPLQQQAQQQAIDVAGGAGGFIPTAQQTLLDTAQGNFLAGGPGFNEAVQASIRAAQPNILSSFGAAGRGVSGLGQSAIQQSASDAFAGLFNQERNRQLQAAQLLPQIGLAGSDILGAVGGQQQAQAERELAGPIQAQQALLGAAGGTLPLQSVFGSQQTTSQPVNSNPFGQALGGGLAGLSVAGPQGLGLGALGQGLFGGGGALLGLLSDRREKTDIEWNSDGLLERAPKYSYRYKSDQKNAPKRVSEMAQDVERVDPSAVIELKVGHPMGLLDTGYRKVIIGAP